VADLPLSAQAFFVTPALRSVASRSMLRSRSSVFWNVCSPLRSRSPDFLPARLRFPLGSHALVSFVTRAVAVARVHWRGKRRTAICDIANLETNTAKVTWWNCASRR